jgi:hypothetical protein
MTCFIALQVAAVVHILHLWVGAMQQRDLH